MPLPTFSAPFPVSLAAVLVPFSVSLAAVSVPFPVSLAATLVACPVFLAAVSVSLPAVLVASFISVPADLLAVPELSCPRANGAVQNKAITSGTAHFIFMGFLLTFSDRYYRRTAVCNISGADCKSQASVRLPPLHLPVRSMSRRRHPTSAGSRIWFCFRILPAPVGGKCGQPASGLSVFATASCEDSRAPAFPR